MMASGLFALIGLLALGITVTVVLLRGPADRPVDLPHDHPGLARLRRVGLASRGIGMAAGVALLVVLGQLDRLGQILVLVPAVFAVVQLIGVWVAEVMTRRDARQPGSAAVEVRRVRDYLPRPLAVTSVASAVVLAGVIAFTSSVASADDLGRAGRSMAYRCRNATVCDDGSFGPWPGSFYTVPAMIGLVLALALTAAALTAAVRRPRNGGEPIVAAVDDAIRRQSISTAVASALLASAGTLAGLGLSAGSGLLEHAAEGPDWFVPVGVLLTFAGLLGLAGLCWSVAALLRPLLRPLPGPTAAPTRFPARAVRSGLDDRP